MSKIFKNKYNEVRSGWAILVSIIYFLVVMIVPTIFIKQQALILESILGIFLELTIFFGLVIILRLFYKRPFYAIGFAKSNCIIEMLYGLFIGFVFMSIVFFFMLFTNNIEILLIDSSYLFSTNIIIAFIIFVCVGFTEEFMFRSYIMTALQTTRSKIAIIIISSVLFSLMHGANPSIGVIPLINIILAGLLLAYMFVKSGKIWISIGFHILWNFMQGPIYGFPVSGNAGNSVVKISVVGNDLITGGDFGAEGGIVVTVVLTMGLLWTHFFINTPKEKEIWHLSDNQSMFSK